MHEADTLALVPGAEPVAVALAASEGELLARLAPLVVEPLVEAPNAGTDVLLHVANVLNKKVRLCTTFCLKADVPQSDRSAFFKNISHPRPLFRLYLVFFNKQ